MSDQVNVQGGSVSFDQVQTDAHSSGAKDDGDSTSLSLAEFQGFAESKGIDAERSLEIWTNNFGADTESVDASTWEGSNASTALSQEMSPLATLLSSLDIQSLMDTIRDALVSVEPGAEESAPVSDSDSTESPEESAVTGTTPDSNTTEESSETDDGAQDPEGGNDPSLASGTTASASTDTGSDSGSDSEAGSDSSTSTTTSDPLPGSDGDGAQVTGTEDEAGGDEADDATSVA